MAAIESYDLHITAQDIAHFLDCARRGQHPCASGGEKRCNRIAKALLENTPGLDDSNLHGIALYALFAARDHAKAQAWLDNGHIE